MDRNRFMIDKPRTVTEREEREKWALAAKIATDIESQNRWNAEAARLREEEHQRRANRLKRTGDL